jgi:hypothetical protein
MKLSLSLSHHLQYYHLQHSIRAEGLRSPKSSFSSVDQPRDIVILELRARTALPPLSQVLQGQTARGGDIRKSEMLITYLLKPNKQ